MARVYPEGSTCMFLCGVILKGAKSFTWLRSLGDPWFSRPNFQASCVAQYLRVTGPATRVAGSNPLESKSAQFLVLLRQRPLFNFLVLTLPVLSDPILIRPFPN